MHLLDQRNSDDTPEGLHLLDEFNKEAELSLHEVDASPFGIKLPLLYELGIPSIPRVSNYPRHCKKSLFYMLPSFVQDKIRPSPRPKKRPHPTAFLDGMRGIAAFLVIVFHLVVCCYDAKHGFASGKHGEHREFLKLPFIRIIYAGPTMVSIFFVVSGYALSYKPVKLMRSKNWKELMHTLASSIFRRAIRLYLPCIISTFLISILIWMRTYEGGIEFAKSRDHYNVRHEQPVERFDSLFDQLSYWANETVGTFLNPWTFSAKGTEVTIDGHLWTIPVEFRSSLVLYLTQAGLARLKPMIRMAVVISLIIWCHQKGRWEMILFYGGFLCADLDFHRSARLASTLPVSGTSTKVQNRRIWSTIYILVFIMGVYLGCQPQKSANKTPGWVTLFSMIPDYAGNAKRYWPGWGAIMLVWSTSNHSWLQRLFTNNLVQYLGRISFSMYIVHGAVTRTIGYPLMNIVNGHLGMDTEFNKALGFGVGAGTTLFFTIWFADIFTRAVDEPSVKFAKWVEEKCNDTLE